MTGAARGTLSAQPKLSTLDLAHVRERAELHLRGLAAITADLQSVEAQQARRRWKRLESALQSFLSARADLQLALRDLDQILAGGKK